MKKAQMQMTQNIAVIIVITFILVFGFIFYSRVRALNITEKVSEYSALELVKSAQQVSNLPELACSREGIIDISCIDEFKLNAFLDLNLSTQYREYYRQMFGKSRIEIVSIFPNSNNFTIYNNTYDPPFNENPPIFIPINIYDVVENELNFGYIQVTQYKQA